MKHTTGSLIKKGKLTIGDGYRAKNSEMVPSGVPFARAGNINQGINLDGADTLPVTYVDEVGPKVSQAGDTVFTSKGTVGRFAFVEEEHQKFIYSPQLCFWRSEDVETIDPKWLHYWLQGNEATRQINELKGQTDMADYVSLRDQRNMKITLPEVSTQQLQSKVLDLLDTKIDLLRRQNETLEALGAAVFREWFLEGGLEKDTIGNVLDLVGGGTPSTKVDEYWNGNIAWTTPRDLSNSSDLFLYNTARTISKEGVDKISSGLLPIGTLLMSSRAPVGYLAFTGVPLAINQGYIAILSSSSLPLNYVYFWLKNKIDFIKQSSNGSVFQEISKRVFRSLMIDLPDGELLDKFVDFSKDLFIKIRRNQKQVEKLKSLRDLLLPKLMSGAVKVRSDG